MMRRLFVVVLALAAVPAGSSAQAPDKKKREKVNVDFVVGWGGCYRPAEWVPILVSVTSPFKKHLAVELRLSAAQDELNKLHIHRHATLAAESTVHIPLATKFRFATDNCYVVLDGIGNSFFWARDYKLWGPDMSSRPLTAVTRDELLIGVSGRQAFGLMRLPGGTACDSPDGQGQVYVKYKFRRLLPPDWTGYAALDLLVLYDADWEQLTWHQSRAIVDWVRNGGRLLLVLGANPLPPAHPIASLLPFGLGPARQIELPTRTLQAWGFTRRARPASTTVTCHTLGEARSAYGWELDNQGAALPLLACGPSGFGAVGVLTCDPAALKTQSRQDFADFWVRQIKPLLGRRQLVRSRTVHDSDMDWGYQLGPTNAATNAVLEHLLSIAELRPLHIGWVVLVLVALAVLIGPVDYLVLRKLGRLPLTWVTASLCITLFSVGAYYGVEYIRAGTLQARIVSVVDGVDDGRDAPAGWATRFAGIYAPHSDEYLLADAEGRPLARNQWWSGMAPTQGEYVYSHTQSLGSRNIYCLQHEDGGNLPVSVPINIWSMQCLLSEAPVQEMPIRAATRRGERRGEWTVTVENLAATPIARSYALVGTGGSVGRLTLGPVAAEARRTFTARPRPWTDWASHVPGSGEFGHGGRVDPRIQHTAYVAMGAARRTEGVHRHLRGGAVVVCAEFEHPPPPFLVAGRDCRFAHKLFARLVCFPEAAKP
jgi:hypothetical protein